MHNSWEREKMGEGGGEFPHYTAIKRRTLPRGFVSRVPEGLEADYEIGAARGDCLWGESRS